MNMKEEGIIYVNNFAVSDSIGETSEQVAQAAASQFSEDVEVKEYLMLKV